MIKPLDRIPVSRKTPQREMAYEDMREALSKNILTFEFEGDGYNYKTLATAAREAAYELLRSIIRARIQTHNAHSTQKIPFVGYGREYSGIIERYARLAFRITNSIQQPKNRVFCEIFPERIESCFESIRDFSAEGANK